MKNSKIEWCHHTVNFWWGCALATLLDGTLSEECRNCYALLLSKLFSRGKATWGPKGKRWIRHEAARRELYKLDKAAHKRGVRERVFINSMSDTFEDRDDLNEAREMLWAACRFVTNLDILLLTKRPENVTRMVPAPWLTDWPTNVWVGTTCGTQAAADERVPALLKVPAKVRFLSCEPLLGPVDLMLDSECSSWRCPECGSANVDPDQASDDGKFWTCSSCGQSDEGEADWKSDIHWVIVGGESGAKARPMHPDWARSLRDQCREAGVAFHFKQHGEWLARSQYLVAASEELGRALVKNPKSAVMRRDGGIDVTLGEAHTTNDDDSAIYHVGKAAAGRLLDGVEHNGLPEGSDA